MKKPKAETRKEKEGMESGQEKKMEQMMKMAEYKKGKGGMKNNYKGKCCQCDLKQSTTMNYDPNEEFEEDFDPDDYPLGESVYW